jgi:hypothetical protein
VVVVTEEGAALEDATEVAAQDGAAAHGGRGEAVVWVGARRTEDMVAVAAQDGAAAALGELRRRGMARQRWRMRRR